MSKAFVNERKDLMAEWDWALNKDFDPSTMTVGSDKKVSWVCLKHSDHKWQTSVYNRAKFGSGCPFCAGQRATATNNLAIINPKLSSEWHPSLNGDAQPKDFLPQSSRKVWWLCSKDKRHEWQTTIANRTKSIKCPICSFKRVHPTNNLLATHPELGKEWHPTLNGDLTPEDVVHGSSKKVWWQCSHEPDHYWSSQLRNRSKLNTGCPYCSNQKLSKTNNLAYKCPHLLDEWHPSLNGELDPKKIIAGSGQRVWWQCKHGHSWSATCDSRVTGGTNCPKCTNQTSAPEIRLLTELKWITPNAESRYKIEGVELDIFLPNYSIGIEYDGSHWHEDKLSKDTEKNKFFLSKGITVIRVREFPLSAIGPLDLVIKPIDLDKNTVDKLVKNIKGITSTDHIRFQAYLELEGFANEELYNKYLSYLPDPFPEQSLELMSPEIAAQWDYEQNSPLVPKNFSNSSNKKVWWRCNKNEDHKWKAVINDRTAKHNSGQCPFCSRKRVSDENSLLVTHPELSKEWHPHKNGDLSPKSVLSGFSKKVWWKCKVNERHEWQASPNSRTSNKNGCSFCHGKVCLPEESIATTHPELTLEFMSERNKGLSPNSLLAGSNKKVWWCCRKCNGEYRTTIFSRAKNGTGCKACAGLVVTSAMFLDRAKEAHGDTYDYSKVEYKNTSIKVKIICPEHGIFHQSPEKHVRGQGCPKCSGFLKKTTESFIEKAKSIHGDRFDYSLVQYVGAKMKVTIICPKHGPFEQTPDAHYNSKGCKSCP